MKSINIFKTGKHTSAGGDTLTFSESDIQASVAAYDPAIHEAPIVIGHPKDNGPAYGWIQSLSFSDGNLDGEPIQVDPEFAEMVQAGRFKKRSASFYHPDSPQNPVPGVFYLRHVGFLGAQPPAVKGLKEVEFSDKEEMIVEFMDEGLIASFMRRMREFLISSHGLETADQVVPGYMVEIAEDEARRQNQEPDEPVPAFSETNTGDQSMNLTPEQIEDLQARAAEAETLAAENAALKAENEDFSEREATIKRLETEAKVDKLVADGKVLPAHRDQVVQFLEAIGKDADLIEFGETDDQKLAPADFFLDFMAKQPAKVEFGEHDNGEDVDHEMTAQELSDKALEYKESQKQAGKTITLAQAVQAVKSGKHQDKE